MQQQETEIEFEESLHVNLNHKCTTTYDPKAIFCYACNLFINIWK